MQCRAVVSLQNISVPAPVISLFSLRVLDSREPSVELRQPLDGLGITYVVETNQPMAGLLGITADEHTFVVHTVDNFIPHSLITPSIFGPQHEVVQRGSQYT